MNERPSVGSRARPTSDPPGAPPRVRWWPGRDESGAQDPVTGPTPVVAVDDGSGPATGPPPPGNGNGHGPNGHGPDGPGPDGPGGGGKGLLARLRPGGRGPDGGREPEPSEVPSRRKMLGVAGAGVGAVVAAGWVVRELTGDRSLDAVPPPPDLGDRAAGAKPSDAGGFASRDASFTAGDEAAANAADANLYASASEAAAKTKVTVPTILATDDPVKHLLRRATFGPNQPLVDEVHAQGIDAWLERQLDPDGIDDATADEVWSLFPLAAMGPADIQANVERYAWDAMFQYGQGTLGRQIWSRRQVKEVMVDFWANHLNVSTPGGTGWDVAPSYQEDVIRKHALGSFTEMLLAAMRHPGMLRYLSNDLSDKDDVNENLGRELLELHTVGVASGYTEEDVRNSAFILTGRTVTSEHTMMEMGEDRPMDGMDMSMARGAYGGDFLWDAEKHWKDPVKVLGFTHPNPTREGGLDVGDEYLRYLATHPSTARNIARKLAVRLVADSPPDTLVDRLAETYLDNDTRIVPMLEVLFRSGEFWAAVGQKVRRPLENAVAAARAVELQPGGDTKKSLENMYWQVGSMGQRPLAWPSPDGYPDVRQAWRSTSAVLQGWNLHRSVVQGWQDGFTYVPPEQLVAGRPAATVGEYVDSLCQRLCLQGFRPEHRDALVAFIQHGADTPAADAGLDNMARNLAPLILDAPYFSLR